MFIVVLTVSESTCQQKYSLGLAKTHSDKSCSTYSSDSIADSYGSCHYVPAHRISVFAVVQPTAPEVTMCPSESLANTSCYLSWSKTRSEGKRSVSTRQHREFVDKVGMPTSRLRPGYTGFRPFAKRRKTVQKQRSSMKRSTRTVHAPVIHGQKPFRGRPMCEDFLRL